ncbi:hypothetical protein SAMN02910456_02008 [Ruminococcaceae bacterium YRB3002]|nr:hypothetical protein SAMN02910456_02008 [Ruminococcaceae bacterium YRB3002]
MLRQRLGAVLLTAAITVSSAAGVIMADDTLVATGDQTQESTQETIDLSGYTFENIYGSQLHQYLDHQYTFEGQNVPLAESNFYFINAFVELTQYYGMYYGTAEGFLDLSADYVDPTKYATFGDFLVSYAERTLESSLIICARADSENLVLSDETKADIDKMIEDLKTQAENANLDLEGYLKLYYGDACSEAAFKEVLNHYYLADLYTARYCEAHITDDMRQVPNVRYALFEAPESTSDDAAKQTAESLANELLTAAAGDLDKLEDLAQQSNADGFCKETNDVAVSKGQAVDAFDAWAYDPARKVGDIEVIYAPEFGYFVVGYLGTVEQDQQVLENQAVGMLSDEITAAINAGTYKFGTEQPYEPAVPVPASDDGSSSSIPVETSTVTPDGGKSSVATVLIIVFAVIGGVAVVAIIIILTAYILKKIRSGNGGSGKASDPFEEQKVVSEPEPLEGKDEVNEAEEDEDDDRKEEE